MQQKRLEDGTPYVGQLGELAYDPDEDKVQCHLCGGWYRAIGSSHLRRAHGWTLDAYRDAFRLPMQLPTCSRHVSERSRANALGLIERGNFGRGAGVPIEQRNVRIRPWRTLAARHPELVRELDSRPNETIDPASIAANSARKLWWRCPDCGHRWQATVGSRATEHGCPECYNERRRAQGPRQVPAEHSLKARHPALAAEWDRGRNSGLDPTAISPKSKRKVWVAMRHLRAQMVCIRAEPDIRTRVPTMRSGTSSAHAEPCRLRPITGGTSPQRDRRAAPHSKRGARRREARGSVQPQGVVAVRQLRSRMAGRLASRTYAGTGCPVCGLRRRAKTQSKVDPKRSLAVKHPEIAAQLHPSRNQAIDPAQLGARSGLKLWWRCGTYA
jgi:predicted  nucleic acid-binding Zn-ribbon protein